MRLPEAVGRAGVTAGVGGSGSGIAADWFMAILAGKIPR
jgi:hypothetical protein